MPRFSSFALLLVLTLQCSSVLADGLFLNGVSPRSIGRGGTNQGFADNGGIIFDNPAAMTNVNGSGLFDIGVDVLITDFEYSDPDNAQASDSSATPLPQIAAIRKSDDGEFAFGLGFFVPAGFSQEYDMNGPVPFVDPRHYESYGSLMKVLPAAAWQVTDRLSVGATLGVAISEVEIEGPYVLQSLGIPTLMDLETDGVGLAASVGLQYQATDTTVLGFTWQSENRIDLEGRTRVTVPVPPGAQSTYDTDLTIHWPTSLALGIRQEIGQRHVVAADVTWFNWGDSFDQTTINLRSPSTPGFPPTVNDPFPLNWDDTVSLRLGYEFDLGECQTLRLGYVYHPNPIPNSTLTPFIQAITEHAVSAGYGFEFQGWNVDLAYMFTTGETQQVGTSAFLGGDFSNSTHKARTHAVAVSLIKPF